MFTADLIASQRRYESMHSISMQCNVNTDFWTVILHTHVHTQLVIYTTSASSVKLYYST